MLYYDNNLVKCLICFGLLCCIPLPENTQLLCTAVANLKNAPRSYIVKRVMLVIGNFKASIIYDCWAFIRLTTILHFERIGFSETSKCVLHFHLGSNLVQTGY